MLQLPWHDSVHVAGELLPADVELPVPGGQSAQDAEPAAALNLPGPQFAHAAVPPALNCPAGHWAQVLAAASP